MTDIFVWLKQNLEHMGFGWQTNVVAMAIIVSGVLFLAILSNIIARRYLLHFVARFVKRTKTQWDDILYERNVFERLSHFAPALVLYLSSELYPPEYVVFIHVMRRISLVYMTVVGIKTLIALIDSVADIYRRYDVSRSRPIKGYLQALKVVLYVLTCIILISLITGHSPILFLSGLGAISAVLLLVFKDSILGIVAGIQLAGNNLVRQGDWIEVPSAGADGDVVDVSLTSVKVQNWNKTITSVPIYSLISGSFTNWRGMTESGGRRIKRSLNLDLRSISFASDALMEYLQGIALIEEDIKEARARIQTWRDEHPDGHPTDEPRPTNVGLFRKYVSSYLQHNNQIHDDMTFLVRQLQSTSEGLPVEVYVFSKDQRWVQYEMIQADIFEHLLAVLPQFELRCFQKPSGQDVGDLIEKFASTEA